MKTRNLSKLRSAANYARLERTEGETGRAREASRAANKASRRASKQNLKFEVDFDIDLYV